MLSLECCVFSQVYAEVSSDTLLFLSDSINQQVRCRIERYRVPLPPAEREHCVCFIRRARSLQLGESGCLGDEHVVMVVFLC